ncbi:MAG: hypothetical protein ACREGR_00555, partial [Minisyncoccia bacterium]
LDSDKFPYTKVGEGGSGMEMARKQFAQEFFEKLDKEEPTKLAAWVEYRLDLTDHVYTDGVGKTTRLLGGWVLMRAGKQMPNYPTGKGLYTEPFKGMSQQRQPVDPSQGGQAYMGPEFDAFHQHYQRWAGTPH